MDGSQESGPPVTPGSAPPSDLVGQLLAGRYRILEKLGEGAMGAVYLGEHVRMGRKDAIKVLRGPLASDPEAIRRFNRGARNVSAVHHPNVCTIYDFSDTAEGVTFLAMELITGESLKDLLEREGALPPARAVALARQVADALQAAHDAGIVHRDLKPGNIMLTRDRRGAEIVKVVDFDIAKGQTETEGAEVTRVGFVVGTPEYMSPEQLTGEPLDGRSDLYSLGLVLFRMLTGVLPFRADSPQDLMVQRLTRAPMRLDEAAPDRSFPPGLQEAIERSLSRTPAGRQPSVADFGREIAAALADAPPAPSPSAPGTVPPTIVLPATARGGTATGPAPASGQAPAAAPPGRAARSRTPIFVGLVVLFVALGSVGWWLRTRSAARATPDGDAAAQPAGPPATPGSGNPSGEAAPAGPVVSRPQSETGPAGGGDRAASGPSSAAGAPATQSTETPAQPPAAAGGAGPAPGGAAPSGAGSGAGPAPTRPTSTAISVANAGTTINRQFDNIGPPYPDRAQVLAIRDTARLIWNLTGAPDKQRALAAYIIGNTYIATGETSQVLPWLQRAVNLDPTSQGYRTLRDSYQNRAN